MTNNAYTSAYSTDVVNVKLNSAVTISDFLNTTYEMKDYLSSLFKNDFITAEEYKGLLNSLSTVTNLLTEECLYKGSKRDIGIKEVLYPMSKVGRKHFNAYFYPTGSTRLTKPDLILTDELNIIEPRKTIVAWEQ